MSIIHGPRHAPLTIALTSYNYGQYIGDAIQSVINQTSPEWRLIIYDNCSTDNTLNVIKPYLKDPRIALVVRDHNIGPRNNLLQALQDITTEFVATLQADDFLDRTYVEMALDALRNHPEIPFVFFNWQHYIEHEKRAVFHNTFPFSAHRRGPVRVGPYLTVVNFVPLHMAVFRSRCLLNCLNYLADSPLNQLGEQFLLKILEDAYGWGYYSGTLGGVWRRHGGQLTNEHVATSVASIEEPLERHWYATHAPNPDPVNVFMALVGFTRLSSHADYLAAIDWLLGKGSRYIESFDIPLNQWSGRFYSVALAVALKFSTYSTVTLLDSKLLQDWLMRMEYAPTRDGLAILLNQIKAREGDTFLSADEILDVSNRFFPDSLESLQAPAQPLTPWLPAARWSPTEAAWAQEETAAWVEAPRLHFTVLENPNISLQPTTESLQIQWLASHWQSLSASGDDFLTVANAALEETSADWIALMDAGDQLAPDASFRIAQAIRNHPQWQLIYTDEDNLTPDGQHINPHCKPDFNLDYLRSLPYTGGLLLIRKDLFAALGGFDPEAEGAEDYDLMLRAWEHLQAAGVGDAGIGHIPEVLYHRLQGSSHCRKSISEILAAGQSALERHLQRLEIAAEVHPGPFPPSFRVRYALSATPLVSIIIPTRDQLGFLQRCIESVIEKTRYPAYEILVVDNDSQDSEAQRYLDLLAEQEESLGERLRVLRYPGAFNFSAMNNQAVGAARGEYVLLLNNDTAALHEDWLDEMMSHALRPDVGIVGAKLLYPDGRIQHAGVILGMKGPAEHPFIGRPPEDRGYFGRAQLTQEYSAVTAACLLVRKEIFQMVGGLDEERFQVSYNDVDLCLKVREAGHRIVWTPWAMLLHEGSASQKGEVEQRPSAQKLTRFAAEKTAFYDRWLPQLAFDPAYNRHLSLVSTDFLLEDQSPLSWDPAWRPRPRVLVHSADREGCGEYRIIAPMRALRTAGRLQGWETMRIFEPAEMERFSPDSIVLQRQMEWPQIEALERHRRFSKAFRVFEIDDLITNLPTKSVHKAGIHKDIAKRFRKAAGLCNRLVVATEPLARAYAGFSDEVRVVPNYLERARWDGLTPRRRGGPKPRVGWAGGVGHTGDLELVADVVRELAKEVDWVFFGLCPDALRPYVQEFYPGVPLPQYPAKLASLDLDLAIAPLEDNPFNEAKSHLRLLEYGVLGYPVVCSDLTPYQGDFPVWRVANRYRDWLKTIREAVSDRDALARQGDLLREKVRQQWLLEDHLDAWLQAWLP